MIFGPFLCSTTFTITNDLRCRGYSSSSSSARKRKRQNSTFLFLVFIDHRIPRFGRKYYARVFEFPCRSPAVSLNTSGIARSFSILLPLPCRIVNTSRLARFFSLIPRFCQEQKSVSLSNPFPLCSAARLTEQRITDSIPRILIDLLDPSIALRVTLD